MPRVMEANQDSQRYLRRIKFNMVRTSRIKGNRASPPPWGAREEQPMNEKPLEYYCCEFEG